MTRRLLLTFTLAATAAVPVAAADAAKPAPYPTVSKIEPMNVGIGDTMTITGKNFVPGAKKNTIVFKRDGKRAQFVKADAATRTQLTFRVPEALRSALGKKNGVAVPSKFRIRVLARRFAKTYSSKDMSPTVAPRSVVEVLRIEEAKRNEIIALAQGIIPPQSAPVGPAAQGTSPAPAPPTSPPPPADCDGDGVLDVNDADDDNDLMTDAFELSIKTQPCSKDSDGDGLWDVFEYESAIDLNSRALPYPGKRPHPNPLDGGDANADWDGDSLTSWQEHDAWRAYGRVVPLNYSDGYHATPPVQLANTPARQALDMWPRGNSNGVLSDEERDIDADGLSNHEEANDQLQRSWWTNILPYKNETPYLAVNEYTSLDWLDRDTDGDRDDAADKGLLDGADDQDFDGWTNLEEVSRGIIHPDHGYPLLVHPFNPCVPDPYASPTCRWRVPGELQEKPYPPFNGELDKLGDYDADPTTPATRSPIPLHADAAISEE